MEQLVKMLFEDIEDHAQQLQELAQADSPDLEQIDYHHAKLKRKLNYLKEAVNLGS